MYVLKIFWSKPFILIILRIIQALILAEIDKTFPDVVYNAQVKFHIITSICNSNNYL